MEKKLLVKDSDNKLIHKFSEALKNQGITEGADCYYIDEAFRLPFFKIPKAYKKENENDPNVHFAFVDIDDNPPFSEEEEYSVHANYHHEHIANADNAAELVKKLITGQVVEVALVLKNGKASVFMENTGDPQKNVDKFMQDYTVIMEKLNGAKQGGHFHTIHQHSYPYYLYYELGNQQMFEGYNAYAVSSVLAEHPEFYILG